MLARWQPPANVDALFDIFALESGHTTEFRSAAQAERNCSLFTSYEDVTDVCWCTGFSLSLPRYGLFDRNFWVADNKETEGKRFVLALQIFTTATAIVMVILVVARFIVNARIIKARGDRDRTTVERSSGQSRTLEVRLRIAEVCRKKTVTRLCRLVFELCLVGIHVPVLCGDWYISSWAWINGWSDQTADRPVFFHYHATDLGFLLWLRLMWPLFRSLRNHSVFSGSEQARALALKLEREDNSQKTGAMFAFKMMLRQQPIRLMVILTSIDVLATSSMVWTLEKAVPCVVASLRRWVAPAATAAACPFPLPFPSRARARSHTPLAAVHRSAPSISHTLIAAQVRNSALDRLRLAHSRHDVHRWLRRSLRGHFRGANSFVLRRPALWNSHRRRDDRELRRLGGARAV